jgi:hypothetical protein
MTIFPHLLAVFFLVSTILHFRFLLFLHSDRERVFRRFHLSPADHLDIRRALLKLPFYRCLYMYFTARNMRGVHINKIIRLISIIQTTWRFFKH